MTVRHFKSLLLIACVATLGDLVAVARADVFELHSGGEVRGEWRNQHEKAPQAYDILTLTGPVKLPAALVKNVVRQRPADLEYEKRAQAAADTVDGHWQVAEWCRVHALTPYRQIHLRRMLELDADHAPARHALGYQQIGGKWVTKEQWKDSEGYAYYQGKWRLAQEIELLEAERRREQAEKEWLGKLRRWRGQLEGKQQSEIAGHLRTIKEPEAVAALAECLRTEPVRGVKMLYLESLGGIGNGPAVALLVNTSISDADEEIFHAAVDELVKGKFPKLTNAYVPLLQHNNNIIVNRAAIALGRLGEKSALEPLIEALVTTHTIVEAPPNGGHPQAVSTTFSSQNNGSSARSPDASFTTGNQSKVHKVQANNQEVLAALVKIAEGSSFGFDKAAWRRWLAAERRAQAAAIDTRRDNP